MNTDMVKNYKSRKEKANEEMNKFFTEEPFWRKVFEYTHYTSLRYYYKKLKDTYSRYNILCEALWKFTHDDTEDNFELINEEVQDFISNICNKIASICMCTF